MVEPKHSGPPADDGAAAYERLAALAGSETRFARRFDTVIHPLDDGWLSLTSLDDDFHSMRIALRVSSDGEIREAAGRMLRNPYDVCPRAIASLASLLGVKVDGSTRGVLSERIPRDEGCLHLADMLGIAFRSFKIARGHDTPWPEYDDTSRRQLLELLPRMRDTCVSFAIED